MIRRLVLGVVVTVVLLAGTAGGLAAAPLADALDAPLTEGVVMGTLGAELSARDYQTMTAELDTESLMDSVNEGVSYGFSFANVFLPIVVIMVGFAVAGGVIGLLMKVGPKIAQMIKGAF